METEWRHAMTKYIDCAYVRLISTYLCFLEPWKAAYLQNERFKNNVSEPMQYLYPTLIDIALQKGQPDVEKLVDQLHTVTLAYVDDKMQNSSPEASASPQTNE